MLETLLNVIKIIKDDLYKKISSIGSRLDKVEAQVSGNVFYIPFLAVTSGNVPSSMFFDILDAIKSNKSLVVKTGDYTYPIIVDNVYETCGTISIDLHNNVMGARIMYYDGETNAIVLGRSEDTKIGLTLAVFEFPTTPTQYIDIKLISAGDVTWYYDTDPAYFKDISSLDDGELDVIFIGKYLSICRLGAEQYDLFTFYKYIPSNGDNYRIGKKIIYKSQKYDLYIVIWKSGEHGLISYVTDDSENFSRPLE